MSALAAVTTAKSRTESASLVSSLPQKASLPSSTHPSETVEET
jgi:hypothetical protein